MQNQLLVFYKKYFKTFFDILLIALTIYISLFIWSYIYKIAFPVLLSIVIAALIRPISKFLQRKGMNKKRSVTSAIVIFLISFILLISLSGALIVTQMMNLYANVPDYIDFFKEKITSNEKFFLEQYDKIPPEIIEKAMAAIENISSVIGTAASNFLGSIVSVITSVSSFIINIGLSLILAYFLSYEFEDWRNYANSKTPKTFKKVYAFLRDNVFTGVLKYVFAQLKLISITFSIVLIGLLIIGANNAFTIAIFAAVFDLVPLLGIPVIFIPWIVYCLIVGKTKFAIFLGIVLILAMVVRQIAEPKIAGEALGVSPFLMLATTLVFMQIFGISAVFLTPLIIILIKQLADKGIIKSIIRRPDDFDDFKEEIIYNKSTEEKQEEK